MAVSPVAANVASCFIALVLLVVALCLPSRAANTAAVLAAIAVGLVAASLPGTTTLGVFAGLAAYMAMAPPSARSKPVAVIVVEPDSAAHEEGEAKEEGA